MKTPIVDFVKNFNEKSPTRLFMPGHKGKAVLGPEALDITEIDGAGNLFLDDGIVAESEKNATMLFGSGQTFFGCEGSSTLIKSMLFLAKKAKNDSMGNFVLATRNVHKSFVFAAALCDFDVHFIDFKFENLMECKVSAKDVLDALKACEALPFAVFLTSPDYLGNTLDIGEISKVCKKFGVPLLCDNAHGAYLRFLKKSLHPISLGADMCVDSAHKTLPVLTGGAYLHISKSFDFFSTQDVKNAISIFSSTSPSYLILQSLDKNNEYLEKNAKKEIANSVKLCYNVKNELRSLGFDVLDTEPLKITICFDCLGEADRLNELLKSNGIFCEHHDENFIVFMASSKTTEDDLNRLLSVLRTFDQKKVDFKSETEHITLPKFSTGIKNALFLKSEEVSVKEANGRVCAQVTSICPPCVPIAIPGEVLTTDSIKLLLKYKINKLKVLKE